MPNSGYPTPDNFDGDATFVCIPIIVPNKPEFAAAIYGLYAQMSNEWFWKQFGTMTSQEAARLSSRGLAATDAYGVCGDIMSCEDIADCIEANEATQDAIAIAITNNTNIQNSTINVMGGLGNPDSINGVMTKIQDRQPSGYKTTPIAEMQECDLNMLWGGIRHGIVDRLDENLHDTLQDIAAIPTIIGRNAAWLDVIPVLGDIAEAIVTSISGVIPTLLSLFEAYSSEATKDELACELFDMVCADCMYPTHEMVYNHFKNYGMPETPDIAAWTLEVMTSLLTNPVGVTAKVAYFTLMTWQLGIIYLQASFNGASGNNQLARWAALGEDFGSDNWQDLCEGCGEDYAYYIWDYTRQQYNNYKTTGYSQSAGTYVAGKGWRLDKITSTGGRITFAQPIDPTWKIKSVAFKTDVDRTSYSNYAGSFRTLSGSNSGETGINWTIDASSNIKVRCRNGLLSITNFQEFALSIIKDPYAILYVEKLAIVFDKGFAPSGAIPTNDPTACELPL